MKFSAKEVAPAVPVFKLYGEKEPWPTPDMLHCESIDSRSRLHDWKIKPHKHNGLFQLLYLASGNAEVRLDDCLHSIHGRHLVVVPEMCVHGFHFKSDAVGFVVTVAYPLLHRLPSEAASLLVALASATLLALPSSVESEYIGATFEALNREYQQKGSLRDLGLESCLSVILVQLAKLLAVPAPARPRGRAEERFNKFSELLEMDYCGHKPVSWYASRIGVTPAHLNHLCRQTVGKPALALIHERLILEAKRHLVYSSMSIALTADKLGFEDPAYFTRFFKRLAGMSPKEFRRRAGT